MTTEAQKNQIVRRIETVISSGVFDTIICDKLQREWIDISLMLDSSERTNRESDFQNLLIDLENKI